jgi:hypothetical protein
MDGLLRATGECEWLLPHYRVRTRQIGDHTNVKELRKYLLRDCWYYGIVPSVDVISGLILNYSGDDLAGFYRQCVGVYSNQDIDITAIHGAYQSSKGPKKDDQIRSLRKWKAWRDKVSLISSKGKSRIIWGILDDIPARPQPEVKSPPPSSIYI